MESDSTRHYHLGNRLCSAFLAQKLGLLGIYTIKNDFNTFDDFTFETKKSLRVKKTSILCIGNTPAFDVAFWYNTSEYGICENFGIISQANTHAVRVPWLKWTKNRILAAPFSLQRNQQTGFCNNSSYLPLNQSHCYFSLGFQSQSDSVDSHQYRTSRKFAVVSNLAPTLREFYKLGECWYIKCHPDQKHTFGQKAVSLLLFVLEHTSTCNRHDLSLNKAFGSPPPRFESQQSLWFTPPRACPIKELLPSPRCVTPSCGTSNCHPDKNIFAGKLTCIFKACIYAAKIKHPLDSQPLDMLFWHGASMPLIPRRRHAPPYHFHCWV